MGRSESDGVVLLQLHDQYVNDLHNNYTAIVKSRLCG